MEKIMLIGLDLSFNSSGITIFCDNILKFYRVAYIDHNLKGNIPNVNQVSYRMPTNIIPSDILLTNTDKTSVDQTNSTIRAMICSKKIIDILMNNLMRFNYPEKIIVTIENYIMPSFGGQNSLKNVSGLILLQGYIREFFIKLQIHNDKNKLNQLIKMFFPTPKQTKKFFTGNGNAEKTMMEKSFIDNYNGLKLLPTLDEKIRKQHGLIKGKLDDIVDSFALMCHGYALYLGIEK